MQFDRHQTKYLEDKYEPGKAILLKACAGSGKTSCVLEKAFRLTQEVKPSEIIALAFGNAAARELRTRYMRGYPGERINSGTLHNMGNNILKDYFGIHNTVHTEWESIKLIRSCVLENVSWTANMQMRDVTKIARQLLESYIFNRCAKLQATGSQELLTAEEAHQVIDMYEHKKVEMGVLDYTDMLYKPYLLLTDDHETLVKLQDKYKVWFIDEAQDLDNLQYTLITMLAIKSYTTFVGDVMQTIYKFRNANPDRFSLSYLKQHWSKTERYYLVNNYRSTLNIVRVGNVVRGVCNDDLQCETINPEVKGSVVYHKVKDQVQEGEVIAAVVKRVLREYEPQDITIISRTNAYIKTVVEPSLIRANIPYSVVQRTNGKRVSEKLYIDVLHNIIQLILNPKNFYPLLSLAINIRGIGETFVNNLETACFENGVDSIHNFTGIKDQNKLALVTELLECIKPLAEFKEIKDGVKLWEKIVLIIRERLKSEFIFPSFQELENCEKIYKYWIHTYQEIGETDLHQALTNMLEDLNSFDYQEQAGVSIKTVHATKGAEFKVVIAAGFTSQIPKEDRLRDEGYILYVQLSRAIEKMIIIDSERFLTKMNKYAAVYHDKTFERLLKALSVN